MSNSARECRALILPGRPGCEAARIEADDIRLAREATDRVLTVWVDRPGATNFVLSARQAERLARDLLGETRSGPKAPA